MNTRTHKHKVKEARRMRTELETRTSVPIFESEAWERRAKIRKIKQRLQGKKKDV